MYVSARVSMTMYEYAYEKFSFSGIPKNNKKFCFRSVVCFILSLVGK